MATASWYFVSHVTGTVSTPNNALGAPNGTFTTDANSNVSWTSRWRLDTAGAGFTASGTQSITLRMRKGSNSGNPSVSSVSLYQNDALIGALTLFSGSTTISSTTSQDLVYQFDGSILTGIETVDIQIATTGTGGSGSARNAASIDSGTWSANYVAGAQNLTATRFDNTSTIYSATVSAGAITLLPTLYTNTNTFYNPEVLIGAQTLIATRYDNTNTFFGGSVNLNLNANRFNNNNVFYSPTVTSGSVTLSPPVISNTNTFYNAQIIQGGVTLSPPLLSNTNTFFSPSVAQGGVSVLPPLLVNSNTFFPQQVIVGAVEVIPSLYSNTNSFYTVDISVGAVTLTPDLFTNTNIFNVHSLGQSSVNLRPELLVNTSVFFTHRTKQTLIGGYPLEEDVAFGVVYGGSAQYIGNNKPRTTLDITTNKLNKPINNFVSISI